MSLLKSNILFFAFMFFTLMNMNAQYPQLNKLENSGETVELFTNRTVFIVGENIHFRISYDMPQGEYLTYFSKVVYVELIKWNGNKLSQVKVPIINGHAHGSLPLPLDIESGNYYLRAYTKWMRNYSQYDYTYLLVKVNNPTSRRTDERPTAGTEVLANKLGRSSRTIDFLNLAGLKNTYSRGDIISFELAGAGESMTESCWISVSRKQSLDPEVRSFTFGSGDTDYTKDPIEFLPELRGLTLSGKALNRNTGEPLRNSSVFLSSVGDAKYFSSGRTDSAGNFLFTFPRMEDELEFHLTSETETAELLIDTDFCNRPVNLAFIPFFLEGEESNIVESLSRTAQLNQRFQIDHTFTTSNDVEYPFYGKANRIINEKEFIELDNLEEFFFELVYEVTVRRDENGTSLELVSQSTLSSYPVLVLMDNIPVRDIDELLRVSCRRVDRIEILDKGYVLGESLHSGIVAIFSERGDMAGIRLGEDSHFFSLRMIDFQETSEADWGDSGYPDIPVLRNTLYWNPDISVKKGSPVEITFPAGEMAGEYAVTIRSMDKTTGEMVYMTRIFSVE